MKKVIELDAWENTELLSALTMRISKLSREADDIQKTWGRRSKSADKELGMLRKLVRKVLDAKHE